MRELNIPEKTKRVLQKFVQSLKDVYQEHLISIILYGSAASGEFIDKYSNLNTLVVLKNTDLENLEKVSGLINKFRNINPLFLTENYISSSQDIFPIEFLDMKENYSVLYGKDYLKDIQIDTKNLRFQCEQELKAKLLNLKQLYLRIYRDRVALRNLLFKSFTSILHVLRNVLRLKGRKPPYLKQEILKALALEFQIDTSIEEKILTARTKQIKLSYKDTKEVFIKFVRDLEKIVDIVDKL
jgi:predicted nucleotidyltransferase